MKDVSVRTRPDLARMEVKLPNYIGGRIFPALPRAVKAGTLFFQDIQGDVTPETGRVLGTAPVNAMVAAAKTTYDLGAGTLERIERNSMCPSEIAQFGGLDIAQRVMARIGMRAVEEVRERLVSTAVLKAAQIRDIGASLIDAVDIAKQVVIDKVPGLCCLVVSSRIYNRISRYSEIADRMKFTGVPITNLMDVRGVGPMAMAAMLGVDRVLVGPNSAWYDADGDFAQRAALVMIPEEEMPDDPKVELQVARMITLELDGEPELLVESFYDSVNKRETVDVQGWFELKTLNPEGIYALKGIDEGNAVTTTV